MGVQIITHDFGEQFYDLLGKTKEEINIISPFIGLNTAAKLSKWLIDNKHVGCTIITRFYREDFIQNASNIEGLHRLFKAGAKIYALNNLHSKVYIFDARSTILGSANFTQGGFYSNHEFGIFLYEEPEITDQCLVYFNDLLERIKQAGNWEITEALIEEEKNQVNTRVHNRKSKHTSYRNEHKWGADINLDNNSDFMEQVLITEDEITETGI